MTDPKTLAMWREAVTPAVGAASHGANTDNVSIKDGHGNSKSYTVARLKRERPDPK